LEGIKKIKEFCHISSILPELVPSFAQVATQVLLFGIAKQEKTTNTNLCESKQKRIYQNVHDQKNKPTKGFPPFVQLMYP